ncbi:FAD-binding oxidoreductase [Noviherbaspirillum sp. L7-7A]|uniref:FAD-binding oxidoreductase n=1 Tax=Noviherbaspirillum sp. L7-7A TaxID=2850560 RepID=UPI001C2C513B|nr:FAD-binding oxidoreductase [Noviherbaspirillum sp. L7-7A]MBV0882148.1 FAD-binding oxidoreductase [Noviherbaspirillum sp. L7-7A]
MTPLDDLRALLGKAHVLTGGDAAPFTRDWHGRYDHAALAVVRPADAAQVAAVVRLCSRHRVAIVPQGGNTGLMGGAAPTAGVPSVVLFLTRLNRIREVDSENDTITAEAGCVLQQVQQAAEAAGRLFPLSLASEGSCTIGGNLSTNAGGTQVLRYGNARELALGVEVVTAEGRIWDGLRGLRKDNTGYSLRDLYIGSEGTLGIITAATLRLYPLPSARLAAFVGFRSLQDAIAFLSDARSAFGAGLVAFELFSLSCLDLVAHYQPDYRLPINGEERQAPWYALVELADADHALLQERFESAAHYAMAGGQVSHAVIAASETHRQQLWHLREHALHAAQGADGMNVKHDIAVPISRIVPFVQAADAALQRHFPGVRNITFGHLGDGNLHYNVERAAGQPVADHLARASDIERVVHDCVAAHGGSISAEHGIGQRKRDLLLHYKSEAELDLMRRVKRALDPQGLLNPGKVLG